MAKLSIRITKSKIESPKCCVGVDTGGTFTDFVFVSKSGLRVFKLASTPGDPSIAITEGLKRVARKTGVRLVDLEVVHGTTVATNTLLERRGARTALVTTAGFEDVLAIGRQARPSLYDLSAVRPAALVPSNMRFGIHERVTAEGEVLDKLNEDALIKLAGKLKRGRVESVAICLLFSFLYPEHERRVAAVLRALGVPISVSHQILPEYREYERTSTVTINAYLQPLMGSYFKRLRNHVRNLRIMQSSGGSISADVAAVEPVRTILSGPAGGVVGALRVAGECRIKNIITFDMGGTSTDVALCDRDGMRMTREALVAGLPVAVSMMDIHTVGAGGGSIARVDEGGSLRVGPESAGADPGPACYGSSLFPTVTDAHLILGHFGGEGLLGGEFVLDEERARKAMAQLAIDMSKTGGRRVSIFQAAQGVLSVANSNMESALRRISVERGYDPREFSLLPFGGAGGLHAFELARSLRIPQIIVPTLAGALSAIGVLAADVVKDQSRTMMLELGPGIQTTLDKLFKEMESAAIIALRREGFPDAKQRHERSLALRYKGQSFELEIRKTNGNIGAAFDRAHKERYGYDQVSHVVEIVSARVRSSGIVEKLPRDRRSSSSASDKSEYAKAARRGSAYLNGKKCRVVVYHRDKLPAGTKLRTPCIVTEYTSTTLIHADAGAFVDAYGNLLIQLRHGES